MDDSATAGIAGRPRPMASLFGMSAGQRLAMAAGLASLVGLGLWWVLS